DLPVDTRAMIGYQIPVVAGPANAMEDAEPGDDLFEGDVPRFDPIAETLATLQRRGFGRLLVDGRAIAFDEIDRAALKDRTTLDVDLVIPDASKSINQGAIEPWSKPHYRAQLAELKRAARKSGLRLDAPWSELTGEERTFVIEGDEAYDGIRGFFRWLDRKKYK